MKGLTAASPRGSSTSMIELVGYCGVRLRAEVTGDAYGPPVVLLHGGGQTRHLWSRTAPLLAELGWRVIALDQRGHGDSGWPDDGAYALSDFAEDIRAIAGSLERPPALVGQSLGGRACLHALDQSDGRLAAALVLVEATNRQRADAVDRNLDFMRTHVATGFGSLEEVADAIAAFGRDRSRRPRNVDRLRRNVRRHDDGRWYWHWDPRYLIHVEQRDDAALVDRLTSAAGSLRIPVLHVRGTSSDMLDAPMIAEFGRLAPHAELVEVEGAGHNVVADKNDRFNAVLVDFLRRRHAP